MTNAQRTILYALMRSGIQRVELSSPPIKWALGMGYLRRVPPYTEKFGLVEVTEAGHEAYEREVTK